MRLLGVGLVALTLAVCAGWAADSHGAVFLQDTIGAPPYMDSRTSSPPGPTNGGLTGNGNYGDSGFTVSWTITFSAGVWTYDYDIVETVQGGLSHFILQLSQFDGSNDFWTDVFNDPNTVKPSVPEIKVHKESEGNPNMPADLYGAKFGTSSDSIDLTFSTTQAPVWGNFYAKDGSPGGELWNVGFTSTPPAAGGPYTNWVAVPDGERPPGAIPEPGSLLVWALLMGAAGCATVRYRRRCAA